MISATLEGATPPQFSTPTRRSVAHSSFPQVSVLPPLCTSIFSLIDPEGWPEGAEDSQRGAGEWIVSPNPFVLWPQPQHTDIEGASGYPHNFALSCAALPRLFPRRMKRSMSVIDLPSLCRGLDFEAPRKKCNSDASISTIIKVGLGDLTSLTDMFSCSLTTTPRKRLTTFFDDNCSENSTTMEGDCENGENTFQQSVTTDECFDSLPAKSKRKVERLDDMLQTSHRRRFEEDDTEDCLIYLPNN